MRGRDFSTVDSILSYSSLSYLESKGENAFLEHERLCKMYFEAIWSVEQVQRSMDQCGMQFEPSDKEWFMEQYHQMLFDVITFYNLGNANQLCKRRSGEWRLYSCFQNNGRQNNQYLSAFCYIDYFYKMIEPGVADSVKLGHILFLNALCIAMKFKNRQELVSMIRKCASEIHELEGFYEYAEEMTDDFLLVSPVYEVIQYIRKENDYFLALPKGMQQMYYSYVKQVSLIVNECEGCADRQMNYGLTECEFDEVLQLVI